MRKNMALIFLRKRKIPLFYGRNLLHISYEGLVLEDPAHAPEEDMWRWRSPKDAPNESEIIELDFQKEI